MVDMHCSVFKTGIKNNGSTLLSSALYRLLFLFLKFGDPSLIHGEKGLLVRSYDRHTVFAWRPCGIMRRT